MFYQMLLLVKISNVSFCTNKNFHFNKKAKKVQQIKGEVFKTNSEELLDDLDDLEGYPNLYQKSLLM